MITTADFRKQIAKPFGGELRKYGFKGTGLEYFKETEEYLITVYIEPSRWGGSCRARFALHPKQVNKDYDGEKDLTKLKVYQYEFKMSLSPESGGINWDYSEDEEENLITIENILKTIKSIAFPIIEKFTITPSVLDLFEITDMATFHDSCLKKIGVYIATTDHRFAWAMALIYEHKNPEKAKQFAEWGLSQSTGNDGWFGNADFRRIAEMNKSA